MALHDRLACRESDVVPDLNREVRVDFKVSVHEDHVPHLSRAHIVNAKNAGRLFKRLSDRLYFLFVDGPVHQVVKRVRAKLPAHFPDH